MRSTPAVGYEEDSFSKAVTPSRARNALVKTIKAGTVQADAPGVRFLKGYAAGTPTEMF